MMHNPRNFFSLLRVAFYILCLLGLSIQPLYAYDCPEEGVSVALVIANSQYENRTLEQLMRDAEAMKTVLTELGFQVIFRTELDNKAMNMAVAEFSDCLKITGKIGLFYFSGYGAQVDGQNYLRPLNPISLWDETDVKFYTFPVNLLLTRLKKSKNELNIIILDACRDDPYLPFFPRSPGLASISTPNGFFVAYPIETEQTCPEKLGMTNSLYVRELTKALKKAPQNHTRIEDVFMQVAQTVDEESQGQQIPQYYGSLRKPFCFGGECPEKSPPITEKLPPMTVELRVDSNVTGANVTIDGTPYGSIPLTVELLNGWHIVKVKKEDYVPFEQSVNLQSEQQLFARLEKKVKLIINCSVNGAKVIIKNTKTKVGISGSIRNQELIIKLKKGEYFVRVEKEGYVPYEQSVNLQSEQQFSAELLKKIKLIVLSNVEGAEVIIKGDKDNGYGFILDGEMNKLLPVGNYTIRIEANGVSRKQTIYLLYKDPQRVRINF